MFSEKSQFRGRRYARKLSKEQQKNFDEVMLKYGINVNSFDFDKLFSTTHLPLRLDIGSGSGEHVVKQAKIFPQKGFVACEPYLTGAAKLSKSILANNIKNIRVFVDDARILFSLLPEQVFDTIYILFPDPWPKKRHQKRRFINAKALDEMSRLLRTDGSLWFATDHEDYLFWTIEKISSHKSFFYDFKHKQELSMHPEGWEETRYQAKAASRGINSVFIEFKRV